MYNYIAGHFLIFIHAMTDIYVKNVGTLYIALEF